VRLANDDRAHPDVGAALADQLATEGIVVGGLLTPERRLPLGGPVVVAVGRARVALGRDVARRLIVRAVATDGNVGPDAGAPA
jgi:Fe2+ transport system protein FeoA